MMNPGRLECWNFGILEYRKIKLFDYSIISLFHYLLVALCLFPAFTFSQEAPPVFDWQIALGGTSYDAAAKVIQATDGGFIVLGTTYSNNGDVSGNHGGGDVFVVK